jgi:hypothetical protein
MPTQGGPRSRLLKRLGWPRRLSYAAIPQLHTPMNDHHFSYPVVVPLRGTTISGHAVQAQSPVGLRPAQPPLRPPAPPTPKPATLAA